MLDDLETRKRCRCSKSRRNQSSTWAPEDSFDQREDRKPYVVVKGPWKTANGHQRRREASKDVKRTFLRAAFGSGLSSPPDWNGLKSEKPLSGPESYCRERRSVSRRGRMSDGPTLSGEASSPFTRLNASGPDCINSSVNKVIICLRWNAYTPKSTFARHLAWPCSTRGQGTDFGSVSFSIWARLSRKVQQ